MRMVSSIIPQEKNLIFIELKAVGVGHVQRYISLEEKKNKNNA